MTAVVSDIENLSLNITEEIHVRSSVAATFAALLEEIGPSNEGENGKPMPMILEPWPGGRWFLGLFPDGYREALSQGLPQLFDRVRRRAERS
jgi:hypothetical protein